ncbi:clip-domain serine proteinase [Culex quinquefasciatus]|uniref:Clip-domain serine proteinase n=1 Tax=Culex quinquefasciatus TaxID=7176 RepID=B0W1Z1_CULQU|nr:clip-domain serine proteinase [Culex quinquefasciatus]|eukprot:XP_001842725.1 clip-domain serine proteinase [Culex quinquefasciatus]
MEMYEMNGLGPYNLNNFLRTDESMSRNSSLVLTRMRVDPTPCQRGNSNQIMCAKNSKFLVPQTCRIEHGGPLERETWHYDRYFQYVFGLSVAGKDCGFGSEAYFVRTSAHAAWIESIVLQKQQAQRRRQRRQIFFPDQEYGVPVRVGQACVTSRNVAGVCDYYRNCPSINNSATLLVKFCKLGVDPMVCCERSAAIRSGYSLKKCVAHWKQFKRPEEEEYESIPSEGRPVQVEEYPHIVFIGVRRNNQVYWRCTGVLVSDEFVLSSGSCVKSGMIDVVRLGAVQLDSGNSVETGEIINIAQILTHPEYDSSTMRADLALIKLSSRVTFNSRVLPACLWPNQDSVPLKLYSLGVDEGIISVRPRLSKYNQDCRKFFQLRSLADDEQLCAENYFSTSDSCLDRNGDPIEGTLANGNIKISIVVGLTAYSAGCPGAPETVTVYTRLSAYMEWIRSIVES